MEKICRICKTERRYDEYHKLFKRCDNCNVRSSLKYYYANKKKNWKKEKNIINIITEKKLLMCY